MAKGTFNCLFILRTARSGFNQVGIDTSIRRQQFFANGHLKNRAPLHCLTETTLFASDPVDVIKLQGTKVIENNC
jgi:hypothetical protein